MNSRKRSIKKNSKQKSSSRISSKIKNNPNYFTGYAVIKKGENIKKWSYIPKPLLDNDVEVKISHCGVCGSDIHAIDSECSPTKYPVIVGHEIVGTIINKGSKSTFNIGDRVGIGPIVSCENHPFCLNGLDSYSPTAVWTYNYIYPDGNYAYGGFQQKIRVSSDYVFQIPKQFQSAEAAPLLCAGVTTYVPLKRYETGTKRKRIGVIGIGGLGHLAVQFANKMGAEVTAISSSQDKYNLSLNLGAKHFINSTTSKELNLHENSLDLIINTASNLKNINAYINLLKLDGIFVQLAIQKKTIPINPDLLISKRINIVGSLVGSKQETKEMFQFAAKHNIKPQITVYPMNKVNDVIKKFKKNKARFRYILKN